MAATTTLRTRTKVSPTQNTPALQAKREVDLGAAAYISYNITSVHINQGWVRNSKTTNDLIRGIQREYNSNHLSIALLNVF